MTIAILLADLTAAAYNKRPHLLIILIAVHGLMDKQTMMHDHSLRVPILITGPDIKAGAPVPQSHQMAHQRAV